MLLNPELKKYLTDVEKAVRELEEAYIERYEEEILSDDRANIRIRIRMTNDFLLEINDAIIFEEGIIQHLGYRYHFQDNENKLLFRYDNTPHFRKLSTFPHHKHLPDDVVETELPNLVEVIKEVYSIL